MGLRPLIVKRKISFEGRQREYKGDIERKQKRKE